MHRQQHRFTLVELLIAMSIFSIVILLVLQFMVMSQRLWAVSTTSTKIYENSRVAMEVIERDIRSAVSSIVPGRETSFYIGAPERGEADNCLHTTFVSSMTPVGAANSRLAEISYRHHADELTANPAIEPYVLARQVTTDVDTSNWNFAGRPNDWYLNDNANANRADFEKVIGGVTEFRLYFYTLEEELMPRDLDSTEMPYRVEIYMKLIDESKIGAPPQELFKTERAFSKVILLGDIQVD